MCRMPEHIQAAKAEADKVGAVFSWEVTSGNHIRGIILLNGKSRAVIFSKTPSRDTAKWDAKRNVRYALRELGV